MATILNKASFTHCPLWQITQKKMVRLLRSRSVWTTTSRQMMPLGMSYAGSGAELNDPDGCLSSLVYSVILCFCIFQDYTHTLNIIFTCLVSLNKWYRKLCIYISKHLWRWFWISESQIPLICLLRIKRSQATLPLTSSSSLRDVLVAIAEVIPAFRDWTSD